MPKIKILDKLHFVIQSIKMAKILTQITAGIIGLWLSILVFPEIVIRVYSNSNFFGIPLNERWNIIVLLGLVLGLLNYFVKPALRLISFPLRVITLGIFNVVINMLLVWTVDAIFDEIRIPWFWPLLGTTIIISLSAYFLQKIFSRKKFF